MITSTRSDFVLPQRKPQKTLTLSRRRQRPQSVKTAYLKAIESRAALHIAASKTPRAIAA